MNIQESNKPHVVAFVFARGGSKGVPGKNIRLLQGKPLIGHAINCALASAYVDRVLVSTDSQEIADVAIEFGAEVPFLRPIELSLDDSPEWLAWRHAITFIKEREKLPDVFLSVPTTAPLRLPVDLDACVEKLLSDKFDIVITGCEAARSPYFNMIKMNDHGCAEIALNPEIPITRRQDAPTLYDITTVAYAARPEFVLKKFGIFQGKVGFVQVPTDRALDIDTELDFQVAECLLAQRR